jgi:hypothetical protein
VTVPEKFVVTFKPGKEMEHLVKSIDSVTAERIRAQAAEIDLTPHEDEDDFSPDQAR